MLMGMFEDEAECTRIQMCVNLATWDLDVDLLCQDRFNDSKDAVLNNRGMYINHIV
jgi:hypothetical protein